MAGLSQATLSAAYDYLHSFAIQDHFWSRWQDVFGTGASRALSAEFQRQWQRRDFQQLPAIEVIAGPGLGDANAAYAAETNSIYFNAAFLEIAPPQTIVRLLIEEIGHSIDAKINPQDTPGDEGESFANTVLGIVTSPAEVARIAAENDHGLIQLAGGSLAVEKADSMVLEVTTVTDENDGSATVGTGLSLRDAVILANKNQDSNIVIRLTGGLTYELRASGFQEDGALEGDLDIQARRGTLLIETTGSQKATLDASNLSLGDRVFDVLDQGILGFANLVITGGNTEREGGGIRVGNNAILVAENSDIRNNICINEGAGIYNRGTTRLNQINVEGNILGAGIYNVGNLLLLNSNVAKNEKQGIINTGSTILINSTIYDNLKEGIRNFSASAGLINTTISGNSETGLYNSQSSVTLNNCTISNNSSIGAEQAGGIHSSGSATVLRNTIVAGNRNQENEGFRDVSGRIFGNNNNLIGSLTGASGTLGSGTDLVNVDPALTPLQNNGGLVLTHALIAGSAAIQAGNNARLILDDEDLDQDGLTTETIPFDARGPGFARVGGNTVDIGAVEAKGLGIPSLRIESVTATEGDEGLLSAQVTLRLNVMSEEPLSIDFHTEEGSAKAGMDYVANTGTIRFEAGEMEKSITVQILGDDLREAKEDLAIRLSNPVNVLLQNNTAALTIFDNEPTIQIQPPQGSVIEGDRGSKNAEFTVRLSQAHSLPVRVNYTTVDDTATEGSDFTRTAGTLTFAPGEVSKIVAVPVLGDETFEGVARAEQREERFSLALSSPSANAEISNATAIGSILDDEATISIQDAKVVEGNSGSKMIQFPVTLSRASSSAVNVNYTTVDGTAVAAKDYSSTVGSLIFAPGETRKILSIPILGDQQFEEGTDGSREEEFRVLLSAPSSNAAISGDQAKGIIVDTDLPATELMSLPLPQQNGGYALDSNSPSISGDGRYVAFASGAANLVSGDTNNNADIFVQDRVTKQTRRVSVASDGTQSRNSEWNFKGNSSSPAISANGRWITFVSDADNLVPGDNNKVEDIFVHDRQTGQTTRASLGTGGVQANRESESPAISADGRYVAFASSATNLGPSDDPTTKDIFVHDRNTTTTTLISRALNDQAKSRYKHSFSPAINASGRFVAYTSRADDLVAGDTNEKDDIFVFDRDTGVNTRVSVATGGAQANAGSDSPSISGDGRYVVFRSDATSLVSGINGGIFLHDRQTGQTTNIVVGVGGAQGNGPSRAPRISDDGRYVVFESEANNLVSGDNNGKTDIFRYNLQTKQTERVSLSSGELQGNENSTAPALSGNSRYVAFQSKANNLVAGQINKDSNVFVFDSLASKQSPALISVSLNLPEVLEDGSDNLIFILNREGSLLQPLTVNFKLGGTASAGSDYTQAGATSLSGGNGSVVFAANAASTSIRIDPKSDTTMEADETVVFSLVSGANYALATLEPVAGILRNDDLPVVTLAGSPLSVSEDGEKNLAFTIQRSGSTAEDLTVAYSLAGSAVRDLDYTGISGTGSKKFVTIAAGSTSATLLIDPIADRSQESNETVSLTLAAGDGYKIGTTKAVVGNIVNDDFIGNSSKNTLRGTAYADFLDGGGGADVLTGGGGADRFQVRFGQSTPSAPDYVTDFRIGTDLLALVAFNGTALPAPSGVTRASNNATASTLQQLCEDVFADADGAIAGQQPLQAAQAALVIATNAKIAGAYILCNDTNANWTNTDTLINIKGFSGDLPALGSFAPSLLFA